MVVDGLKKWEISLLKIQPITKGVRSRATSFPAFFHAGSIYNRASLKQME
jgi:hypothetical protein